MPSPKLILILIIVAIAINAITFTFIYFAVDDTIGLDDAFYYSVQIQTSVGAIDTSKNSALKNWITAQSVIMFILNITLAIYVSIAICNYHGLKN